MNLRDRPGSDSNFVIMSGNAIRGVAVDDRGSGIQGTITSVEHFYDINGHYVGKSDAPVRRANRYVRAMGSMGDVNSSTCAAGGTCGGGFDGCVFCPDGALRPVPDDGFDTFSPAIDQARYFWHLSLSELVNRGVGVCHVDVHEHASSLGAVLLSVHARGHNCLNFVASVLLGQTVPHCVKTVRALRSWAGRKRKMTNGVSATHKLLVISVHSVGVEGPGATVTHFSLAPGCYKDGVYSYFDARYVVQMRVMDAMALLSGQGLEDTCVSDDGYPNPLSRECVQCQDLVDGYMLCGSCGYVVKEQGHVERCDPAGHSSSVTQLIMRRAQLGDTRHRYDVLVQLMKRQVPEKERTEAVVSYVSGDAQAAWMRSRGFSGIPSVLSTWFESAYDSFRADYLQSQFGVTSDDITWQESITMSLGSEHKHLLDPFAVGGVVPTHYLDVWQNLRFLEHTASQNAHVESCIVEVGCEVSPSSPVSPLDGFKRLVGLGLSFPGHRFSRG